ncbi:MAG: ROK family protein [Rubellimicrobium sp.]|nr:ROK family protein [Rubellimicrobium sp.]
MPLAAFDTNQDRPRGRPKSSESAATSLAEVLNLVRSGIATTRQELERYSDFGRSVVADRVALLTELGLVDESESGTATGGRAPRLVRFCPDRGRLMVAMVEQSALGVGLADMSGRLLTEHHEALDTGLDAGATRDRLVALFRWLLSRHGEAPAIWGISIAVPGPVLTVQDSPVLTTTPDFLPGWRDARLVETLIEEFGSPVWMRSGVETMTMGEMRDGQGQGVENLLFVKVGRRIGAGLVSRGRLFRGAGGAVGLIGQLPVTGPEGEGTLDAQAGAAMVERAGRALAVSGESPALADILQRGGEIGVNEVCQVAQMGDPAAMEIVTRSGRLIGQVVATLASMLDPRLIVLAGTLAQTNDIFLAAVRETVYRVSHPLVTRDLRILRSQMGGSAALTGAAWIGTEELFRPDLLKEWVLSGSPRMLPALQAVQRRD